jgi:hypothetical protein
MRGDATGAPSAAYATFDQFVILFEDESAAASRHEEQSARVPDGRSL